jgi:hypothetical protein
LPTHPTTFQTCHSIPRKRPSIHIKPEPANHSMETAWKRKMQLARKFF